MPTYHAKFIGRTKGAIGVFHLCESFIDGATPDAANLALYDTYEHIVQLSLLELPTRYVLVSNGQLWQAMQGRHTYETAEQAEEYLSAVKVNNRPGLVPDDLHVGIVPCWPGHFDPIRRYID